MNKATPFDLVHADDMFMVTRDELFIIGAMIAHAAECGNMNFRNPDEANAVLQEANIRIRSLLEQCTHAAAFWGKDSPPEAQAA